MDFLRSSANENNFRERKTSSYGSLDRSWARRARSGTNKKRPDLLNIDFNLERERPVSPANLEVANRVVHEDARPRFVLNFSDPSILNRFFWHLFSICCEALVVSAQVLFWLSLFLFVISTPAPVTNIYHFDILISTLIAPLNPTLPLLNVNQTFQNHFSKLCFPISCIESKIRSMWSITELCLCV